MNGRPCERYVPLADVAVAVKNAQMNGYAVVLEFFLSLRVTSGNKTLQKPDEFCWDDLTWMLPFTKHNGYSGYSTRISETKILLDTSI